MPPLELRQFNMNDKLPSQVVLDSARGFHGTAARNTEDFSVSGKVLDALNFNGNSDVVDCGSIATIRSVAVWFNHDTPLKNFSRIFSWNGNFFSAYVDVAGNITVLYGGVVTHVMLTVIMVGVWYFLVITHDGTDVRAYLNSVQQGSPYTRALNDTAKTFRIGRYSSAIQHWDGPLDIVRLYDFPLLDGVGEDIDLLFNNGFGTEEGLAELRAGVGNPRMIEGVSANLGISLINPVTIKGIG